jgi:MoaA/NifB/PqqE/SkfB family radical SAM enzyme
MVVTGETGHGQPVGVLSVSQDRQAAGLARELGLNLRLPKSQAASAHRRPGEPGCDWPWRSAYLNLDGTVQPCCMLLAATRGPMGNTFARPISQLWHDHPYLEVRTGLLGPDPPPSAKATQPYRHRR